MIRKFYDVEAPVMSGVFSETFDPALFGKKAEEVVETPVNSVETPEEVPETKAEVVETPESTTTSTPESENKVEVEVKEVPKVNTESQAEPQVFDWKAELKKQDRIEALKELGLDEFEIGLLEYRKQTGDLTEYIQAKTVDFDNMTPEQIMRYDLKQKYKTLSDKEFEYLAKARIADKFKTDADLHGDEEAEMGKVLLKIEAEELRVKLKENQAKFKAPERQPNPAESEAQRQAEIDKKNYELFVESVKKSDVTKALLKDKRVVFGDKDSSFNYEIADPAKAVEYAINPMKMIVDFLSDAKGNPDLSKVYQAYTLLSDMQNAPKRFMEHGKTLGEKKTFESLPGADPKKTAQSAKSSKEPQNEYEAMAMAIGKKWS